MTGSQIAGSRRLQVHTNQFILSRIDARNGAFGLIPNELEGAIVSNDFPVFEIDRKKLLPKYLHWLSKTNNFVESCKTVSEGTTNRVRLKEEKFLQISMTLPTLAEQQLIIAKIERLTGKIEEAKNLRKDSYIASNHLIHSNIYHIMNSLKSHAYLGQPEIATIICGQHLTPEDQTDSGIPYATGPADFTNRIAQPSRFASVKKAFSTKGDVLLTVKGAGVGKVNLAPNFDTIIGRQLFSIRPSSEKLDQVFLWYALQFSLTKLLSFPRKFVFQEMGYNAP